MITRVNPAPNETDRGSATVWTVGAIAMVLTALMFVLYAASVVTTRHRAESAADLAALGAAERAVAGTPVACGQVRHLADQMHVAVTACRIQGWDAYVEVDAQLPADLHRFGPVHARARAGPAPDHPNPSSPTNPTAADSP